ncbi:MAG: sigma-54-dependent Fis family transcriptional regulator [Deltaproteobacteria bacterium]|nr:sigma-54-dependent Fis family transcriptional regulator [Deltaproteobacteria bacterium]
MTDNRESSTVTPLRVLIIDDERNIRTTLAACLEATGCTVTQAPNREAALAAVRSGPLDLAFLDLRLGTEQGMDLLPELLAESPDLEVVVITAYGTIQTAVEAMRRGARDYLPKPFEPSQVRHIVDRVVSLRGLAREVAELRDRLGDAAPEADLASRSSRMLAALEIVRRAAAADAPVLFRGESGTGKTVLARFLHGASRRAEGPFVGVSCPTLSGELLASELFGHARGAFTGAVRDQQGKVEAAEGGTLFLDEVAEMPVELQAKLLRFLQEKRFERVGETRTRTADVRIAAATNRDLEAEVCAGRFREDLLYRLNVIEVPVPPLRERPEDVLALAEGFLRFFARTLRRPVPELSPAAREALLSYTWPGNVRELRNAMERALILWPAALLEPQALPGRIAATARAQPRPGGQCTLQELEDEHIRLVLARSATVEEAARVLGIDSSTLWRKRKRLEGPRGQDGG